MTKLREKSTEGWILTGIGKMLNAGSHRRHSLVQNNPIRSSQNQKWDGYLKQKRSLGSGPARS